MMQRVAFAIRRFVGRHVDLAAGAAAAAVGSVALIPPWGALIGLPVGIATRELRRRARRDLDAAARSGASLAAARFRLGLFRYREIPSRYDQLSLSRLGQLAADGSLRNADWSPAECRNVMDEIAGLAARFTAEIGDDVADLSDDERRHVVRVKRAAEELDTAGLSVIEAANAVVTAHWSGDQAAKAKARDRKQGVLAEFGVHVQALVAELEWLIARG